MKPLTILFAIFLFLPLKVSAEKYSTADLNSLSLKEIYNYALKTSEQIAISEQAVKEAEALYRQALGSSMPLISFRHQQSWEDEADSEKRQMFRLSKTSLTGYREIAAIRSGKSTASQREFEQQRAEQLLLADVAAAFYGLLQAKKDVLSTEGLIDLADKRHEELRERVRVGRTRETDSIGQEYQISTLHSQLEESARQMSARHDLINFLAGTDLSLESLDEDYPPLIEESLEEYLAQIDKRPDIRALVETVNVAKRSVDIARSDYFPDLDLTANSYTDRPHVPDYPDWDVTLAIDLPLWDWKSRRGQLDAAKAALIQKEEALKAAKRQAALAIRNAYRDFISAKTQLNFKEKSVELARRDYEMQARDDLQGLVTNLEVFESLNRLNSAELALNNARLKERLSAINLELTSGLKPQEILE